MREIRQRAAENLDWYSDWPSCFISAFDDFNHAQNWGWQRKALHIIDTTLLPRIGQWVYWVADSPGDEYLFLNQIPGGAIVESQEIKTAECKCIIVTIPYYSTQDGTECLSRVL